MPALLHKLNYTYAEYLGFEASSNVKHEFLDSGDKFEHYKTFPSLREYVLVSHREHSVEVRSRGKDGWQTTVVREGAIAELSIGARLDVRELYDAAAEPSA